MSDETSAAEAAEAAEAEAQAEKSVRQRSSVAFPYTDLNAAIAVAAAIHDKVGNGDCSLQQLSAWMDQSIKSSGFRVQLATARLFGLIESEGTDAYRITPLGRRIVDPDSARKAKVDAFLSVPLFQLLYQNHLEGILPPAAALEREIGSLGVPEKQKDRARQVFERSAEQAGFFEHGRNRLVMPAIAVKSSDTKKKKEEGGGGNGSGGGVELALDPLLVELLKKIPSTAEGWPADKRVRWFRTFAMNVSQIYDADDNPVELKISIVKEAAGEA